MIKLNFSWKQWWTISAMMSVSALPRPGTHVVFIMVDDMGWNDVSFHGSDQIPTPNIDTLAYHGVILQQYYSEAICTPARTALLTGKYPMRLGMHGNPLFNSEDRGIPLKERLLPSYLKELGYSTHLVGKWHVGMSREEYLPTSRGYDTHYGMRGGYIDYYTYNKVESWPNGHLMFGLDLFDNDVPQDKEQRYIVDALTDRAVKIIQHHNMSQPIFLHVTHNAPHAGNSGGALQPPLYTSVKHMHIANSNRRLYAEIVTHIDRSVGKIITALAERGILDDTVIIFQSDNGAPTVGSLNNWGINLPFRGTKYTPWEGGVRVPAFIWHSSLRSRVWNGLMHITDWMPTIIAAAGGQVKIPLDGVNQWNSILEDRESKRKEVLIALEDSNANVYASYRAGDYKIVVGNVTGRNNDYYGRELLINRSKPPEYFPTLRTCEVSRIFEDMGMYLDIEAVQAKRKLATIKQLDTVRDQTPCLPTPNDPHDGKRLPSSMEIVTSKMLPMYYCRLKGDWNLATNTGTQFIVDMAAYFRPGVVPIQMGKYPNPWMLVVMSLLTTGRPSAGNYRGCLFNVRRDPAEQHDLWQRANDIAVLLTSRLRGFWSLQNRREPPDLKNESDPANFGYNWMPWITILNQSNSNNKSVNKKSENINLSINFSQNRTGTKDTTRAVMVNCDGTTGIRNFLCLLRSVF